MKDRVALRSESRDFFSGNRQNLTRVVFNVVVIEDAERQGLLHPHTGSRIFEGTVGSTGISIATIAKARLELSDRFHETAIMLISS